MFDNLNLNIVLYVGIAILLAGSVYLIVLGVKVHKLFSDSIVGRLVKALVVVLVIELYSLGLVSSMFIRFYPRGIVFIIPIIILWILSLAYAIYAINGAKREVFGVTK